MVDWIAANCRNVGNQCNLQRYVVGFIMTRMFKLAITHSILTWSKLYIAQDYQLLVVMIFLTCSTTAYHDLRMSLPRCQWIRMKLTNGRFIKYATHRDAAPIQTPVNSSWPCQCSHWTFAPEPAFKNGRYCWKQQDQKAAPDRMLVNPYQDRLPPTAGNVSGWGVHFELCDQLIANHNGKPPWRTNSFVRTVWQIECHFVGSSGSLTQKVRDKCTWERTKRVLNTINDAVEPYMVEVIAWSRM